MPSCRERYVLHRTYYTLIVLIFSLMCFLIISILSNLSSSTHLIFLFLNIFSLFLFNFLFFFLLFFPFLYCQFTDIKTAAAFTKDVKEVGYGTMRINNYRKNGEVFNASITVFPIYDSVIAGEVPVLTHFATLLNDVR